MPSFQGLSFFEANTQEDDALQIDLQQAIVAKREKFQHRLTCSVVAHKSMLRGYCEFNRLHFTYVKSLIKLSPVVFSTLKTLNQTYLFTTNQIFHCCLLDNTFVCLFSQKILLLHIIKLNFSIPNFFLAKLHYKAFPIE